MPDRAPETYYVTRYRPHLVVAPEVFEQLVASIEKRAGLTCIAQRISHLRRANPGLTDGQVAVLRTLWEAAAQEEALGSNVAAFALRSWYKRLGP